MAGGQGGATPAVHGGGGRRQRSMPQGAEAGAVRGRGRGRPPRDAAPGAGARRRRWRRGACARGRWRSCRARPSPGPGTAVGLGLVFPKVPVAQPVQTLDFPVAADEPAQVLVAGSRDRLRRQGTRGGAAGQAWAAVSGVRLEREKLTSRNSGWSVALAVDFQVVRSTRTTCCTWGNALYPVRTVLQRTSRRSMRPCPFSSVMCGGGKILEPQRLGLRQQGGLIGLAL